MLRKNWALPIGLADVGGEVFLEQDGSFRSRLAKNVEPAFADEPILRVRNDDLAEGERHGTEIPELRRVANRVGFEKIPVLGGREAIPMLVPFMFELREPPRRLPKRERPTGS